MFIAKLALAALLRIVSPDDHRYTLTDLLANNPYTTADWQYEIERRPEAKTHHCTCACTCEE